MSDEDMKAELERLRSENAALKTGTLNAPMQVSISSSLIDRLVMTSSLGRFFERLVWDGFKVRAGGANLK